MARFRRARLSLRPDASRPHGRRRRRRRGVRRIRCVRPVRRFADLESEDEVGYLLPNRRLHLVEEYARLARVFHLRVHLRVAAQPDAALQVVHYEQMLFPLHVELLEEQEALDQAHALGAEFRLAAPVGFSDILDRRLADLPGFQLRQVQRVQVHAIFAGERFAQAGEVPLAGGQVQRQERLDHVVGAEAQAVLRRLAGQPCGEVPRQAALNLRAFLGDDRLSGRLGQRDSQGAVEPGERRREIALRLGGKLLDLPLRTPAWRSGRSCPPAAGFG